ncbi:hypothetical protein OEA41_000515 [Lepraria neglecta]|uniref:Uncharacterized protein n=1 Tax=Lepraria neglecta TaxID=209136 RepID=A0AAD9ZGL5_9LECA|nr:hypothetical protein OEA41_000515 [Lepraria neglecta]
MASLATKDTVYDLKEDLQHLPEPLRVDDMLRALGIRPGDQDLNKDTLPKASAVLSACSGLVIIDEESQIVKLVHYTTEEYCQRKGDYRSPEAHRQVAGILITCADEVIMGSGLGTQINTGHFEAKYRSLRAWTPLVSATKGNNPGIIKLLVEYGADLEMVGSEEVFTALEYTVHKEKVECIQVLLELGADPRSCMPFDLSKVKQSEPYRIVAEALEVVEGTPLKYAIKWGRPFQVKKGSFRKAQQLYHDETFYQAYLDELDEMGYACYDSDDSEA